MRGPGERFLLLDGLRGVAVLAVVFLHVADQCGANLTAAYGQATSQLRVGVTLFFLLSGFLLYRPYARAIEERGPWPSVLSYGRRRVLRIVPAYWVALTALALWPGLSGVFTRDAWVYYGFAQSYRNEWVLKGIAPAWSLSVEMAFYAVLPLLAAVLHRAGAPLQPAGRVWLQLGTLAVLGLGSLALRGWCYAIGNPHLQTTIFTHFLWFAIGMILAVWHASLERAGRPPAAVRWVARNPALCWLVATLAYVALSIAPIFPRAWAPGHTAWTFTLEHVLYACVALPLMLPAVFGEEAGGWPRRVLANGTLRWLGLISYSVFLWHQPLMAVFVEWGAAGWVPGWPVLSLSLLALAPVLAVSWLSFVAIEQPMLRRNARPAALHERAAA